MIDIILETVRALVLLGILIFLWNTAGGKFGLSRNGWNYILSGFLLLFMGSVVDITDNFESLNRFVIIGDTPTEAFLEKFVGFLGGFLVLAVGLIKWIPGVECLTDEIAVRRRVENALMKSHDDLRKALSKEKELNELQRQFIAIASHEFRTPLAIIDGAAQRLKRKADNNQLSSDYAVQRVEKIRGAVQRMTRLMDSTLTAARMEEGTIKIDIGPCDIGGTIREVCERQQDVDREHVISCELDGLPETIQADTGALEQVLTNLLSNAVKYSPSAVHIEVTGLTQKDHVVISVHDHGLGIDEDDLPKMFGRFFRARTSSGIAGTGIGLSVVKELVEMHDGTISVESIKGKGSTFTMRLPIAGPDQEKQAEPRAA